MLRFAYWAGLAGVVCALGLALLAWSGVTFAAHAAPYIALFISIFVSFSPAIMAHPAHTRHGGRFNLNPRALAVAEPWTIALVIAMLVALSTSAFLFSPRSDHFTLDSASLLGRTDRQLMLSFFFGSFHALAVCAASSGLRWGLYPTGPTPSSWFSRLLTPPLDLDAPLGLPGAPFTYRIATVGWPVIALEFVGAVAAFALTRNRLPEALPLPHANLLALALFWLPVWHSFLKGWGEISFVLDGANLLTRHFPFVFRNRCIHLSDIRGIQVNSELDGEGNVTHYALLLVREHGDTDRLVDKLPSAEHARVLARQIDSLIRIGTAGSVPRTR